jgi:hypothetical protein
MFWADGGEVMEEEPMLEDGVENTLDVFLGMIPDFDNS